MTVLFLVLPHNISARSALVMLIAIYLTWLTAPSVAANVWWGTTEAPCCRN
ncbi:hypothetical protein [Nitrosomonas sp. Is79A3]|uniref:hypothetical protein n=1 Tax=Nitrosomonas sp. (strain Is79A3) TaxID=261292 RepID=UPI0012E9A93B